MGRIKTIILILILFIIPIAKGEACLPDNLRETSFFLLEVSKYWLENIERFLGLIIGAF